MGNPRDYAMPGNQDPDMPWPNSLLLLSAMASVTQHLRLVAGAIIAPLRHPLLLARELGTLDLISEGRLVVQPTVSWSRDEYAALGLPFAKRGKILDEQLEILQLAWQGGPIAYAGEHFAFEDITLSPRAYRPDGPRLWFGGQGVSPPLLRRLVRYGHGFHPVGEWTAEDLEKLSSGMTEAGRDIADLERVGGTRAVFPDDESTADIGQAMEPIREQIEAGFTTFCVKPSQFIDDVDELPGFCRDIVRRAEAMTS
jgi:alkanesulfonate monooxygenase SsuD/methylene tetrahydromethanopterin reductase-like flavin-dependent oxidoreductase (luciferase family)